MTVTQSDTATPRLGGSRSNYQIIIKPKTPIILTVLALTFASSASAENIALTNPSFETGLTGTQGVVVSGWFNFETAVSPNDVSPGSFWGGGAGMTGRDGANAAYATSSSESSGGSIYQTVQLDAGVQYILTVGVGMSASTTKDNGKFALVVFDAGFGTLEAQTTGTITTRGGFTDYTVKFTPTTTGNYQIGARNRGFVPGSGTPLGSTIFFDNVRLKTGSGIVVPTAIDVASNDSTTTRTIDVPVSNTSGSFSLDITDIQVTGLDAGLFTVLTPASNGAPFTVGPQTDGTIQLSFAPGGLSENIEASLEIASNDPDSSTYSIPISGQVRDPWVGLPASITVPPLTTDAPSQFQVTVSNLGATQNLEVDGIYPAGVDGSYFSVVTDFTNPLVIAPGDSAPVTLSFDPNGEFRDFAANLEIRSNDSISYTTIVPVTAKLEKPAPAPLTIRIDGNSFGRSLGEGTGLKPLPGAPSPDEYADNSAVPPSGARNFYYDSDGDLAFTSPGDSSGNTNYSLDPDIIVSGNKVLDFYLDNDGNSTIGDNFVANAFRLNGLTVTLSDGTKIPLDVTQGTPQTISDPSGKSWSIALNGAGYLTGGVTDIVGNVDSTGDGDAPDYHFTLNVALSDGAGFDTWAGSFGIPNNANDDTDRDGIPALVEYGLGLDPTASSSLPAPQPDGSGYTVTWPKGSLAAADPQIGYQVEISDNLTDWAPAAAADLTESGAQIRLSIPGGQGRIFARIGVIRTAP